MDINITGNPGTGNSYTEVIVKEGGNYNNMPNVTTVNQTTIIYGDNKDASGRGEMDEREKQIIKTAILEFVGKLKGYVSADWASKYDTLWVSILALPEVEAQIYDKGRQRNTLFNRALVGGIVKVMMDKNVFKTDANPTTMAPAVGDSSESFRKEMGCYPSSDIETAVKKLIDKH